MKIGCLPAFLIMLGGVGLVYAGLAITGNLKQESRGERYDNCIRLTGAENMCAGFITP